MAEKSFGAKKIKLDGSGTPTIQSPGTLNLNAVTVGVSTNLTAGGTVTAATFSGSGASLTNLPGANLTGTVNVARLGSGASNTKFLRGDNTWQTVSTSGTPEGTAILSTGESGGTKFLREDGDGTCSWQTVSSGNATNANKVNIQETNTGTRQVVFCAQNGTGNQDLYIDTNDSHLSYDPNLGRLYTPNYTGGSGGTGGSGLHHLSSTTINRDGMTVGANQSASAPEYLSSNYVRLDAHTGNLKATGICTATHFYGNGSNLTGVSASAEGISTDADFGINGGDNTGLSSASTLVFGTSIGQKFGYEYYSGNQNVHLRTSNSSSYNYGTLKVRTDRGQTGSNYPVYTTSGGASIIMAQYDGDVLLCSKTGNFNIGESTGGTTNTGWHFDVTGQAKSCVDSGSSNPNSKMYRQAAGDAIQFIDRSGLETEIGSVYMNTSSNTTTYNTTSDYRLKENVVNITGALAKINQLRPVNFNFIGKSVKLDGFIAHEVQAIIPYAVKGNKDAVKTVKDGDLNNDGSKSDYDKIAALPTKEVPEYQQLDYSKLVGLLTASVQELSAKNDALEARIAALES